MDHRLTDQEYREYQALRKQQTDQTVGELTSLLDKAKQTVRWSEHVSGGEGSSRARGTGVALGAGEDRNDALELALLRAELRVLKEQSSGWRRALRALAPHVAAVGLGLILAGFLVLPSQLPYVLLMGPAVLVLWGPLLLEELQELLSSS